MYRTTISLLRPLATKRNPIQTRLFTTTPSSSASSQNSTPGWTGRSTDDHAVKRSTHDVQAEAAQAGMKAHEKGDGGNGGTSRRDEHQSNKKAKEEHPEAPEPVIGMNSERGSKGHGHKK